MVKEFAFAKKASEPVATDSVASWKVLIVDDEPDIHATTKMALGSFTLEQRKLSFLSAHSMAEALQILERETDIALAFVDVVMETDDAGLRLINEIRNSLKNTLIRVVLRTGQPGAAPENDVIVNYDINDYKAKTELTTQKLFTTTVSALRSYQQLMAIEMNKRGLQRVLEAVGSLYKAGSMREFSNGVLEQLSAILMVNCDGMMCVRSQNTVANVLAVSGGLREEVSNLPEQGHPISKISLPENLRRVVDDALAAKKSTTSGGNAVVYIPGQEFELILLVGGLRRPLTDIEGTLLTLFCQKIAAAYENMRLFQELESRVEQRTAELKTANEELHRAATTDFLTGLLNRRAFMTRFREEGARVARYGRPSTLLAFDIDKFKSVNDTYGHQAGDEVLKAFAKIVAEVSRESDFCGRIGGEEFAVVLVEMDSEKAAAVAERFRAAVEGAEIDIGPQKIKITTSIGLATLTKDGNPDIEVLMREADTALYKAKHNGRNRVEMAT